MVLARYARPAYLNKNEVVRPKFSNLMDQHYTVQDGEQCLGDYIAEGEAVIQTEKFN